MIVNRKPESQINLKNYRFEILDSRHVLLAGVDTYLLRLDLKKEGLVENMELVKIVDLADHRFSFVYKQSFTLIKVLNRSLHIQDHIRMANMLCF